MTGRIESYLHSDLTTPNKGGAMVRVVSDTDFGARTDTFVAFAQGVAKRAYAAQAGDWNDVVALFPEMETQRFAIQTELREKITVTDITIFNV